MEDSGGLVAAVGDAPRVVGVGCCWIDKHDDAILRNWTRKPCGEGGCTRICTAGLLHSSLLYSRSCQGSAAVNVLGLFPLHATSVIPRSDQAICWGGGKPSGSHPRFSPVFGELRQCSTMSRQQFTGGRIACKTPVHHVDNMA